MEIIVVIWPLLNMRQYLYHVVELILSRLLNFSSNLRSQYFIITQAYFEANVP